MAKSKIQDPTVRIETTPTFVYVALNNIAKQLNKSEWIPQAMRFEVESSPSEINQKKVWINFLTAFIGGKYTYRLIVVISPQELVESENEMYKYKLVTIGDKKMEGELDPKQDLEEEIISLLNRDEAQKTLKFLIDNTNLEFPDSPAADPK